MLVEKMWKEKSRNHTKWLMRPHRYGWQRQCKATNWRPVLMPLVLQRYQKPSLHMWGGFSRWQLAIIHAHTFFSWAQSVPGNWCLYSMPNKHFYSCCYKSKRHTSAYQMAPIPKCSHTSLILHRLKMVLSQSGHKLKKQQHLAPWFNSSIPNASL